MKRLGLYALILITFFSVSSSFFSPEKAFAQTSPSTMDEYRAIGQGLFNTQITALNAKRANPGTAPGIVGTTVEVVDALIRVVTEASSVFNTSLGSGTGAPGVQYKQALLSAKTYISTQQAQNPRILRQPYAKNLITVFTKQLEDTAF